jgi:2-polyprenyl-6-methoxyphenol hydroxylase-like FAD-dependent oxidoreductase
VTPQMGQGCNSALEDCTLLAQALEGAGYDVQAGLAAFEAKRAPQVSLLTLGQLLNHGCLHLCTPG